LSFGRLVKPILNDLAKAAKEGEFSDNCDSTCMMSKCYNWKKMMMSPAVGDSQTCMANCGCTMKYPHDYTLQGKTKKDIEAFKMWY